MAVDRFSPVRFSESMETLEPAEEQTIDALKATLRDIMQTTQRDYKHAVRSVHAKSHALLNGTMTICGDLPPVLAQGLFSATGDFPIVMRISTIPGDLLDDSVSVPRGIALKVINAPGARIAGSESDTTQDFVLANGPAFGAVKASDFLSSLKLLAKTTDKGEWAKKALSTVLRGVEKGLEAVGGKSALIKTLGGHPLTHPAGDTYFSQTAFRYGDYVAKFSLVPISTNLTSLTDKEFEVAGRPDAWREELISVFSENGATWDFRVQLLTDESQMPVEDASVVWPEGLSPYITVATVRVEPQNSWSAERALIGDDQLSFSPWHGLAAHRPLGSINRVRQATYAMSASNRAAFNGCPIHEPKAEVLLPA